MDSWISAIPEQAAVPGSFLEIIDGLTPHHAFGANGDDQISSSDSIGVTSSVASLSFRATVPQKSGLFDSFSRRLVTKFIELWLMLIMTATNS